MGRIVLLPGIVPAVVERHRVFYFAHIYILACLLGVRIDLSSERIISNVDVQQTSCFASTAPAIKSRPIICNRRLMWTMFPLTLVTPDPQYRKLQRAVTSERAEISLSLREMVSKNLSICTSSNFRGLRP